MPKALYDQSTGTFLGYLGALLVSVHIHLLRGFRKGKCDTGVSKKIVSRNNDEVDQVGSSWIR